MDKQCKCSPAAEIPSNSREFFIDQCGPRLMSIDNAPVQAVVADVEMVEMVGTEYIPTASEENAFDENHRRRRLKTRKQLNLN